MWEGASCECGGVERWHFAVVWVFSGGLDGDEVHGRAEVAEEAPEAVSDMAMHEDPVLEREAFHV